ncbi:hypothetical protein BOTBODRAFT_523677 [Botryobasidium botryosum FD-172 SS1]|uniref:Uncharacterized protein n=1 Tax=Botryobasidium botryosum (strain FD-172 SS1) TaxID=930990 RepID=A0A067M461_BOTB1|nr:hypothetical protein BOTBODRAFT_523677 [Botryobasidium botryosum FD-172 SS1]
MDEYSGDPAWWDAQFSELLRRANVRLVRESLKDELIARAIKITMREGRKEELHCECQLLAYQATITWLARRELGSIATWRVLRVPASRAAAISAPTGLQGQ